MKKSHSGGVWIIIKYIPQTISIKNKKFVLLTKAELKKLAKVYHKN
ncbi:MAG: hypothetical protein N3F09_02200 [Bacteroidia bacterium]|nr:hypothetical protein [Bacteroidia bacterium]